MVPMDQTLICADSRRTWFVIIFFLLMFATAAAVALTVYTHRDYLTIQVGGSLNVGIFLQHTFMRVEINLR